MPVFCKSIAATLTTVLFRPWSLTETKSTGTTRTVGICERLTGVFLHCKPWIISWVGYAWRMTACAGVPVIFMVSELIISFRYEPMHS